MKTSILASFLMLLLNVSLMSIALATKFSPSEAKQIFSENKHDYIDFNPASTKQKVMHLTNHKHDLAWVFPYRIWMIYHF